MRTRILVSGYYGFGNTGDEAILAAIAQNLESAGEVVVLSATPSLTRAQFGVQAIPRMDLMAIQRELSRAALFISGGGGLLQDATGLKSVPYYAGLLKLAQWRRVPTMILGAGIGPLSSTLSRTLAGSAARACKVCAVRDEGSAALLRALGVPQDRVVVTADPVLALARAPDAQVDAILDRAGANLAYRPTIAVAIRPWHTWFERQFKSFSAVLAQLADRYDAQIMLLPFQRPHDDRITQELADCLNFRPQGAANRVIVIREVVTPSETMGLLARCHLVVGMRLHALIMAAAQAVPFVGLAYDPKVESFSRIWDMPVLPGIEALEDHDRFEHLIAARWRDREALAADMRAKLPALKERALENFVLARQAAGLKGDLQWV